MIELSAPRIYDFEEFRLDGRSRRLTHRESGESVPLTPKAAELLLYLVDHRGRAVSKDELLDKVWGNSFVEESNLSQTIFVLRKSLGEKTKEPRFIITKPGFGYEFIAKVGQEPATTPVLDRPTLADDTPIEETAAVNHPMVWRPKRLALWIGIPVVAIVAVVGYLAYARSKNPKPNPIRSIAILPFRGLASNSEFAYLGPGLADVLVTKLSRIKSVVVRPASATAKYADPAFDSQKAGLELGVDAVLVGTIQPAGEDLRINVQLIRVADRVTIWAETFDSKMTSILAVQDSIAEQVSQSLAIQLGQDERRRVARNYTANAEAFQLYLQGRFLWSKRTPETLGQAIAEFDKAKKIDPEYALAYVGAAACYVLLPQYKAAAPEEAHAKAKAELRRALEIDPEIAEAHSTLAYVQAFYDWDWSAADVSFRKAIELDPNSVTSRMWFAEFLYFTDRRDESDAQLLRALSLEPRSALVLSSLAANQYYRRNYDRAIDYAKQALEIDPASGWGNFYLGFALEHQGHYAEAANALANSMIGFGEPVESAEQVRKAFAQGGINEFWRQRLTQIETLPSLKFFPSSGVAFVHARLGHKEEALRFLVKAFDERDHGIGGLRFAVDFDLLLDDPKFQKLIAQVGN